MITFGAGPAAVRGPHEPVHWDDERRDARSLSTPARYRSDRGRVGQFALQVKSKGKRSGLLIHHVVVEEISPGAILDFDNPYVGIDLISRQPGLDIGFRHRLPAAEHRMISYGRVSPYRRKGGLRRRPWPCRRAD